MTDCYQNMSYARVKMAHAYISRKKIILYHVCLQVAPVVDASSSQSRADVLVILLSAVLLLTGLQWLALRPKVKPSVSISVPCGKCIKHLVKQRSAYVGNIL